MHHNANSSSAHHHETAASVHTFTTMNATSIEPNAPIYSSSAPGSRSNLRQNQLRATT